MRRPNKKAAPPIGAAFLYLMLRKISGSSGGSGSSASATLARRLPSGTVAYGFRYRDKHSGRQRWIGLGLHGDITPDLARKKALKVAGDVRDGGQPLSASALARSRRQAASHSLDELLNNFMARYVRPNLRSADEIGRCFDVYVRPVLGGKPIYDLRRRDMVELLDTIEDNNGPVMCDRVLAHLRKCFNWQAARDDAFTPPIVKGMARTKPAERARKRVLDDQEIRDLWNALDGLDGKVPEYFAAFVRTLLLTGQRRHMVAAMLASEVHGCDWVIPAIRNKGKVDHLLPLTDTLLNLLDAKNKRGFMFSSDSGRKAFSGFSKAKAVLDTKLAAMRKAAGGKPMQAWVFHDLRRTARSLMARAGVPSDHAEQVLGHVVPGVRGVYDRHEYRDEKLAALEKLGALLERILQPGERIVSFPKEERRKAKAR
jgi:integrase